MPKLQFTPTFVQTKNVRNFLTFMEALLVADEGCLGLLFGRAGRGKTRTCQWWCANNPGVYVRVLNIWKSSSTALLAGIADALGILNPPRRQNALFAVLLERLSDERPVVFFDEPEKLAGDMLNTLRDLSDMSGCPFVLVGEEELTALMKQNRRIWSRTYQQLEYRPLAVSDVVVYCQQTTEMRVPPEVGTILHQASDGDIRLIRRDVITLIKMMEASGVAEPTVEMARQAVKAGFTGN